MILQTARGRPSQYRPSVAAQQWSARPGVQFQMHRCAAAEAGWPPRCRADRDPCDPPGGARHLLLGHCAPASSIARARSSAGPPARSGRGSPARLGRKPPPQRRLLRLRRVAELSTARGAGSSLSRHPQTCPGRGRTRPPVPGLMQCSWSELAQTLVHARTRLPFPSPAAAPPRGVGGCSGDVSFVTIPACNRLPPPRGNRLPPLGAIHCPHSPGGNQLPPPVSGQ